MGGRGHRQPGQPRHQDQEGQGTEGGTGTANSAMFVHGPFSEASRTSESAEKGAFKALLAGGASSSFLRRRDFFARVFTISNGFLLEATPRANASDDGKGFLRSP